LKGEKGKLAEHFSGVFGDEVSKKLFCENWNLKNESLKFIEKEIDFP